MRVALRSILFLLVSASAYAQQTVTIQLATAGGKVAVTPDTRPKSVARGSVLSVVCDAAVDCTKVRLMADGAVELEGTSKGPGTRSFSVTSGTKVLEILIGADKIDEFPLEAAGAETPAGQTVRCEPLVVGQTYDRAANRATFVVSHFGDIWAHPSEQVDENDEVVVIVRAPADLIPNLKVRRTSTTRTVGGITILGAAEAIQLQSRVEECAEKRVVLSDFAPGIGQVQISLQPAEKEIPVGTFEFSVAALYDGYLSFAAVYSDSISRTYKLAPVGNDEIIVPGEATGPGDREIRYAVFYTPFLWAKREIVKGPEHWYHRLNPTFGLTISELAEHFLTGISFDYGGFVIVGGVMASRQTILSPDSGLSVGDAFSGSESEIPTAKDWTFKGYVGGGIDFRAVVSLMKAAAGAGKIGK